MAINGVLTDLEGHVGLWCGCFPAISSIIKLVSDKLGAGSGRGTKNTQSQHIAYTTSRNNWKSQERGYEMMNMGVEGGDGDSQRAIMRVAAGEADAGGSVDHEGRGIYKETEFTVSEEYETRSERDAIIPAHARLSRSWDKATP